MIYEQRTYTLQPGKQPEYLKLNAEVGRKIRGDKYGKFEGGWTTEFGTLNQYVHLWSYPDLNERERLRGELAKNEEWTKGYVPQIRPLLLAQENKILSAVTPFKPPADSGNIYELRWYRAQVGKLGEWLNLAKGVLPSREKYSRNVCYWQTEAGQLNDGRAREGARRSRLAGVPREGASAADDHAGRGARPDVRFADEVMPGNAIYGRPSGAGALRRRPDGE